MVAFDSQISKRYPSTMNVAGIAAAVVERIQEHHGRLRERMLWDVTDVLLQAERSINEARSALQDADMLLITLGVNRSDPVRKRIVRALDAIGNLR